MDYGSASTYGPAHAIVSRGLSTLMWNGAERRLAHIEWRGGWHTVRDALTNPSAAIARAGGWETWLGNEMLPHGHVLSWAVAANVWGHVIEGGITSRHLSEWYEHRGVPAPVVVGTLTVWAANLLNETVENANRRAFEPGPASTVADVYFWEPLGSALFRIDPVARFFANTLSGSDWSPQRAIVLPDLLVENQSALMSYKAPLPFVDSWRVLALIGQGNHYGLQWRRPGGLELAGAAGFSTIEQILDDATSFESITATLALSGWVSRDDSLLGSLVYTAEARLAWQANLYPGVLPEPLGDFGLWLAVTRSGAFSLGVSMIGSGGMALGWHTSGLDR